MNFIRELPESKGFHTILVVTDQFSKVQDYILANTTWTAEDVTDSCIHNIWKLYGLLRHTTSNCGPQLASNFLQEQN